ncbi:MAG: hypothetical protein D3924_18830 [Candidatus Electrothrix sp. AR4]|nr:hypothetical protein [Candidatus Electrothrix sp. AR4]
MFASRKKRPVPYSTILAFLLTIFFSSPSVGTQKSQVFMQLADEAYQKFDNFNALAYAKKAYKIEPKNFESLAKMVRAYNDIGEDLNSKESEGYFEQAVRGAEQLFEQFPDKAETYYLLAVSYGNLALLKGGKEKVKLSGYIEKNARKAIELKPDYADAYVVLGIYYKEVASLNSFLKAFARFFLGELPDGSYDDAVKTLQRAIELQTTNPVYTYFHLGYTYEQMEEFEKAKASYQHALQLPLIDHQDPAVKRQIHSRMRKL